MKPKYPTPVEIRAALKDMNAELASKKAEAAAFLEELDSTSPESLLDEGGSVEQPEEIGAPIDEEGGEGMEEGKEGKEPKIENADDAKDVLNEAKNDLSAVVDALDEVMGEGVEEEKKASVRRFNPRYASAINTIREKAETAISDADSALKHWAFILKKRNPAADVKDSNLKQAMNTLKDVNAFWNFATKLLGRKVEATAVPPTGAEFSGDKWPNGKDPKMVEDRAWHKGADKFDSDVNFENARPNPAVDHRLDTTEYSRDDKPFVNASFKFNEESPYDSYWEVTDTKSKRVLHAPFIGAPDKLGKKNRRGLDVFGSEEYGKKIVSNVILQEMKKTAGKTKVSGIDFIKSELNADEFPIKTSSLVAKARDPKVKDKAKIRRYYADAYGSPEYARELTSKEDTKNLKKNSGEGSSPAKDSMDVEYTPEHEHPKDTNTGEDEPGEAKNGPGTLSSKKDPQVIKARVAKALEAARIYASRGIIPFTKQALYDKAKALLALEEKEFGIKVATIEELPVKNENAIKQAHIPDTETGIVGNPAEGVSDPKATVKTEGIDSSVKGDAKVSESTKIVPQMVSTSGDKGTSPAIPFTTVEAKLRQKGVDVGALNLRRPRYRS